jgi:F-type H+-transporting ATPase subunit a
MSLYKSKFVPTNWQLLLEFFYKFIVSMVKQQAGKGALNFFPIVFVVFFFILFCNLIGLLPFGVTVTAQLINTFLLALSFNLGFIILGFFKNGFGFLRLFVPSDAPKVLIPLIVCIELVSYTIRTFSLSLRLFANMMAGHTLLHILTSFVLRFWYSSFYIVALFPLILVLMITVLEFGIAFLQAYVFSILLCIYLNDSLHPGH